MNMKNVSLNLPINSVDDVCMCDSCFNRVKGKIITSRQRERDFCYLKRYDVFGTTEYCTDFAPITISDGINI